MQGREPLNARAKGGLKMNTRQVEELRVALTSALVRLDYFEAELLASRDPMRGTPDGERLLELVGRIEQYEAHLYPKP